MGKKCSSLLCLCFSVAIAIITTGCGGGSGGSGATIIPKAKVNVVINNPNLSNIRGAFDITEVFVQAFDGNNQPIADTKVKAEGLKATIQLPMTNDCFIKAIDKNSKVFSKAMLPISKIVNNAEVAVNPEHTARTNAFILWTQQSLAPIKNMDVFNTVLEQVLKGSNIIDTFNLSPSQIINEAAIDNAIQLSQNSALFPVINEIESQGIALASSTPVVVTLHNSSDTMILDKYFCKPNFIVTFDRIGFHTAGIGEAIYVQDFNGDRVDGVTKSWRGNSIIIGFAKELKACESYMVVMATDTPGFKAFEPFMFDTMDYIGDGTESNPFYADDTSVSIINAIATSTLSPICLIATATINTENVKFSFGEITFNKSVTIASSSKILWNNPNGIVKSDGNIVVPMPSNELWPANTNIRIVAIYSGIHKGKTYYFKTKDEPTTKVFQTEHEESLAYISPDGVYYIYTAGQLDNIRSYYLNKKFLQIRDISLASYTSALTESNGGWKPIGDEVNPFIGSYNGNGHSISGLNLNSSITYTGLFGYVGQLGFSGTEIKNVKITKANIKSPEMFVGGLAGLCCDTAISGCSYEGTVEGTSKYVGGLVGNAINSILTNCSTKGDVRSLASDSEYIGGLIGYGDLSTVLEKCSSSTKVEGIKNVGGLIGTFHLSNKSCKLSFATGNVSGTENVGGLIGSVEGNDMNPSLVLQCYATGNVSSDKAGTNIGGLIGCCYCDDDVKQIEQCSASGKVQAGNCTNVGGLVGLNHGTIQSSYATGEVIGKSVIGGLIGDCRSYGSIYYCYRNGARTATTLDQSAYVGYLIGRTERIKESGYCFFVANDSTVTGAPMSQGAYGSHLYSLPKGFIASGKDAYGTEVTWSKTWESMGFNVPATVPCFPTHKYRTVN